MISKVSLLLLAFAMLVLRRFSRGGICVVEATKNRVSGCQNVQSRSHESPQALSYQLQMEDMHGK